MVTIVFGGSSRVGQDPPIFMYTSNCGIDYF